MKSFLQSLSPFLRQHRKAWAWGFVFIVAANVFSIWPAQLVRQAMDEVQTALSNPAPEAAAAQHSVAGAVLWFGALVLGMAIVRGLFMFGMRQTIIVASRKIEFGQKNQLFNHFQSLSQTALRRFRTGDLMTRIGEDVGYVREFTGPGIMYTLNTASLFIMVLVTMLSVNPMLTLYTLAPLPVLSLLIYVVHNRIIRRSAEKQAELSNLSSFTQEAFAGIRLIRSYAREDNFRQDFRRHSLRYKAKALRLVQVDALFFPMMTLLIGLSMAFIVWVGGEQVIAGQVSYGNIAEFMIYLNLLIWPMASLGWVSSLTQRAIASQRRIDELLALESELRFRPDSEGVQDARIEFRQVSYTYPATGIEALKDVSFRVADGQTLGVVGRTGSGKTTLVQLLTRMYDPTLGEVRLGGQPLEAYSREALLKAIAYVPQDVFLFSDTIRNNISFGCDAATEADITRAAEFAGVWQDIQGFPQGLDTVVGERGVTLSGGQKQRISIARAHLRKPRLLILDDSLSAVDTETEEAILRNLRSASAADCGNRPTLVIVAHRLSAVQHADHIVVMDGGRVAQQGTHAHLVSEPGLYARLWEWQQLIAQVEAEGV